MLSGLFGSLPHQWPSTSLSLVSGGYMAQGSSLFALVLDHQPHPDVHLTNVAVQKTSPDYHAKKVRKLGFCLPGPAFWDRVGVWRWGTKEPRTGLSWAHSSPVRSGPPFPLAGPKARVHHVSKQLSYNSKKHTL